MVLSDITSTVAATVAVVLITPIICFGLLSVVTQRRHGDHLEVTQLYVYPIKGIRGCAVEKAYIGPYGMLGDRTFCLQRVHRSAEDETKTTYETMLVGHHLQLILFYASIEFNEPGENATNAHVVVRWKGHGTEFDRGKDVHTEESIRFPLIPSLIGLERFEVSLHGSKVVAHDMGDSLSDWFSDRLGFEARLVHIGDGSRPVLGSMAPNSKEGLRKARWMARLRGSLPLFSQPAERLVFNDIAHYLVVTEESNHQVSSRLEDDCQMDITKFRPNIVVKGASRPFVEDFWGELSFEGGIQMSLTANCYRCQSITVDYKTGKTAKGDEGMVWKKLNKDRRVDKGAKYSPVFGRYGYCTGTFVGNVINIGQKARVTQINTQRTTFDWPHLTNFGLSQTKK